VGSRSADARTFVRRRGASPEGSLARDRRRPSTSRSSSAGGGAPCAAHELWAQGQVVPSAARFRGVVSRYSGAALRTPARPHPPPLLPPADREAPPRFLRRVLDPEGPRGVLADPGGARPNRGRAAA